MIVDCALYRDGQRQNEGPMALEQAAELCTKDQGFVWLGLFEPDEDELIDVQRRFGLHDLAVEDAQNFHLRPKIERYDGRRRAVRGVPHRPLRRGPRGGGHGRGVGVPLAPVHHHRAPGRGERPARRAAAARGAPRVAQGGNVRGPLGDPRHDRRRLCPGDRGTRVGRRGGRADRVQRRRRTNRADLPAASRGDRFLPRGSPAAGAARGARARHVRAGEPRARVSSSATSTTT